MKVTAEQLDKAAQAIKEAHHEYHPTTDDYREMATAAFAVVEPEPVNIPGDLLEKAIAAGQTACGLHPNPDHWNRVFMAAALETVLSDPRVTGDPTETEWKAYSAHTPASDPAHARICATIFAPRRERLLRLKTDLAVDVVREKLKWYGSTYAEEVDAEKIVALVREADAKERDRIR